MRRNRIAWAGLVGLAWIIGIVLFYYAGHKPLTPDLALALLQDVWRLVVSLGLLALAGGLGQRILPALDLPPLARLSLQAALGLGIFSLAVLIVGSTLGLPAWLPWLAALVLAIWLRRSIRRWLFDLGGLGELWRAGGRLGRALAVMLVAIFFFALLTALAPPLSFDSLVEHLVMPGAYLQDSRVSYLPWITFSGMPQNAEMLYTWGIALGGNQAAALLSWGFGLLAGLGVLGYLADKLGARAAWAGAVALLAGFSPVILLSSAYVDWLVMLFGLGTLVCLDAWRARGRRRDLFLAGVFAGLAVGCKYTAGTLALAALVVVAWQAWRRRSAFLPSAFQFGGAGLMVALPWFVKNGLTTGNPFYPFFFTFGTASQVQLAIFQRVGAWGNALDFFLVPLRATLAGFEKADGYMFSTGPLLLALGALAWLGWKNLEAPARLAIQNAAIVAAIGCLSWAVANQFNGLLIQTRYYMALFPAFALLAAAGEWGLRQVAVARVRLGRITAVLILLAVGFNVLEVGLDTVKSGAPQAALGLKSQDAYLADNLGWFQPAMQAIRDLPASSRALLLYEPRALYCQPRCIGDEIMDRWKQARALYQDDFNRILAAWRGEGFTHLLLYRQGIEFLVDSNDPNHTPDDLHALNAFLSTLPAPVKLGGVYELYALKK